MDKIIIDGVDVSGCAYITYRESNNPICSETGQYCNGYDICYFKQLKCLKKKNEQLKKEFKDTTDGLFKIQYALADSCKKYEQALQEVREIAREQLQDVSDRCINTTPMYIVHKHIIAKINEVIGAE